MSLNCRLFIVIVFLSNIFHFLCAMNKEDLDFYLQEVESLSELPLNRLIQLKSIFLDKNGKSSRFLLMIRNTNLFFFGKQNNFNN